MAIDQYFSISQWFHRVPGEVELLDRVCGDSAQVGVWVEAVVARAHVDIVDVEQEPAAGAPRKRGQELPFGDRRTAVFEITRDVFDEDAAAEILLYALDAPH